MAGVERDPRVERPRSAPVATVAEQGKASAHGVSPDLVLTTGLKGEQETAHLAVCADAFEVRSSRTIIQALVPDAIRRRGAEHEAVVTPPDAV